MFPHFKLLKSPDSALVSTPTYGFTSTLSFSCVRGDVDVSAVCQYQIADVKKVFEGSYKEYREAAQRWGRYTGTVPVPRPGAVRAEGG